MNKKYALVSLLAGLVIGSVQAAPINGGFESGLTGWTSNLSGGAATVVNSHLTIYGGQTTYSPTEGKYFLAIQSGSANVWQTVSQMMNLSAGQKIKGYAAFNWGDYNPYLDGVQVQVLNSLGAVVATPFYLDGTGLADGFNGPWTPWSFTAQTAGSYTLVYGARNTQDGGGPEQTYGYFDAAQASQVPAPLSLALVGLGLAGIAASRRRSRG